MASGDGRGNLKLTSY